MGIKKQDNWTPPIPEVAGHWGLIDFDDAFYQLSTNGFKIAQKEYLPSGTYPIIDQGQEIIGGYTNNPEMILDNSEDSIVFGDHTRCFKLISYPFAPGADGIKVLKPINYIDLKFAFYTLKSIRLPNRGYSRHFSFLSKSVLPFCHPNEQKRIVSKIEELFSELDKGVENLKLAQEQLKIYRQSILKHAFEGKLTTKWREDNNIIFDWEELTFNDVLDIVSGKNQKHVIDPNGKYPIYGSAGIFGKAKEYLCEAGTTIIGRKGTIDTPIYVEERFWNVDTAFGLSPFKRLSNKFLFYFCKSFNFKSLDKSTTIPSLAKRDLLKIVINVPKLDEQKQIVTEIEEKFSVIDRLEQDITDNLKRADILRQAILKKAFSGQLVEQDPNDEPASVLLERIKTEKGNSKKKRGTK